MTPFTFHPEVWPEAIEQSLYLEEQRPGYGVKFIDAFDEVCQRIAENPERFPSTIERPDLRYVSFPYTSPFSKTHKVFYHYDGKTILITCLFPNSRSEKIWQNR